MIKNKYDIKRFPDIVLSGVSVPGFTFPDLVCSVIPVFTTCRKDRESKYQKVVARCYQLLKHRALTIFASLN